MEVACNEDFIERAFRVLCFKIDEGPSATSIFIKAAEAKGELSSGVCLGGVCFDCLMAAYQPEGVMNVTGVQWYNFPAAPESLLC